SFLARAHNPKVAASCPRFHGYETSLGVSGGEVARPWISRPGPRRLPEGRPGSRGPCRPRFWRRRENPCSAQKFPAHSLLGAKKIPARPRRESYRKTLESKAFSAHIFAKEGRVPYKFAARREFSLAPGPFHLQEPLRLRQLHRRDLESGAPNARAPPRKSL